MNDFYYQYTNPGVAYNHMDDDIEGTAGKPSDHGISIDLTMCFILVAVEIVILTSLLIFSVWFY